MWCKDNKLCAHFIINDMSYDIYITCTRSFIEEKFPEMLDGNYLYTNKEDTLQNWMFQRQFDFDKLYKDWKPENYGTHYSLYDEL